MAKDKKDKVIVYRYRGGVERGKDYTWRRGYSADGENGGILYPWMTKRECQHDAKVQGCKAVFVE